MTHSIKLLATDIDGTLLNSQHQLTPRTEEALKKVIQQGILVILATGKTRSSALDTIQRLNLDTPGVYSQGLMIYNADGTIRHQQSLDNHISEKIIRYAETNQCSLLAYSDDQIYTSERDDYTDIVIRYHEPIPQAVGPLMALLSQRPFNKFMFVSEPEHITHIRDELTPLIQGQATLTQALTNMLEVLPAGASKGAGLKRLLDDLNMNPQDVLAIGDGENDIEMIQLAGIGVAVANAMPKLKAVADYIVASNDEDGLVEAIERFIL